MLIDLLEQLLDVDVDDMDPEIVKSLPFKCHDVTSNNIIVGYIYTFSRDIRRTNMLIIPSLAGTCSDVCSREQRAFRHRRC